MNYRIPKKGPDTLEEEAYNRALWLAKDYLTGKLGERVRAIREKPVKEIERRRADILYGGGIEYGRVSSGNKCGSPTERQGMLLAMLPETELSYSDRAALADYEAAEDAVKAVRELYRPGVIANVVRGTAYPFERNEHSLERRRLLRLIAERRGYINP